MHTCCYRRNVFQSRKTYNRSFNVRKMVTDFSFSSLDYELMKKLKIDMHDVMIVLIALALIL